MLLNGVLSGVALAVSCVLVVAHRSLSKCDRSRKYNNPNNKIIVAKIKTLCRSISVREFREV